MTGPLTLPGLPTAPNQASDRQYVDNGLTAKADLISGVIPAGELGTGVASSATCLTGISHGAPVEVARRPGLHDADHSIELVAERFQAR